MSKPFSIQPDNSSISKSFSDKSAKATLNSANQVIPKQNNKAQKITRLAEYPLIAAEKLSIALDRLYSVHARFGGEISATGTELSRQSLLAQNALADCKRLEPALTSIAENLRLINSISLQASGQATEGFSSLKMAVSEVQVLIEALRTRTQEMRGIEAIGQEVSSSVNRVAETAVENKLISINAAITASKASDKVRGFKVIASEISRLSALISDRVVTIVNQASQVGTRMETTVQNMDEGILSTQKALGSIDQAFALLENVITSITDAQAMNEQILKANIILEEENSSILSLMNDIELSILDTSKQAQKLKMDMNTQEHSIADMKKNLPGYLALCKKMADSAKPLISEEPKIFRMKETAIFEIDPTHARFLREIHFSFNIFVRLLRYSSDQKIVPYLADSWMLMPDGKTWEFSLKRDATFFDGSAITSRDVKFSLERLMNPELASPYASLYSIIEGADEHISGKTRGVSGIVTPDSYTVRITLKSSFNFFLSLMALGNSSIIKGNPSYYSRKLNRHDIMSAGAFSLEPEFENNCDRLTSFSGFLNGRSFLDGLEIYRDVADVKEAFLKGELDGAYNMQASFGRELMASGYTGNIKNYSSRYCYGLVINYKRKSWLSRHKELYRALSMAIDKDLLIKEALDGYGERADSMLPHSVLGTEANVFIPYNLEKAKAVFDSWRTKEDFSHPVKIAFRAYPALPNMKLIEKSLKKVFELINAEVETEIVDMSKPMDWFTDKYDAIFSGFIGEVDLYSAVEPFISHNGGDNWYDYFNQDIYDFLMSSISIKDNLERRERFADIMKALTNDGFMVPLFFQKVLSINSSDVHGLFLGPEESYISDIIYLWPKDAITGLNSSLLSKYHSDYELLDKYADNITSRSATLLQSGRELGASLSSQQKKSKRANELFNHFIDSATAASKTRKEMITRIQTAAFESLKTGQATKMIHSGILELVAAVEGTRKALGQVLNDIALMQSTTDDINSSNKFIASIAVNAAIIAAKSEHGTGDLRKVSESISEQAKRNEEYTEKVVITLAQMEESVRAHDDALAQIAYKLASAAKLVEEGGNVLERVGPLLNQADERSRTTGALAESLAGVIEVVRNAVDQIQAEADTLALQTDTLKFGLDLEQGVADILGDIASINKEIQVKVIAAS